jgi:glutathione-regulated potassium-efflux system ancillary protein KefC
MLGSTASDSMWRPATGHTFGTISALLGLNHGIINQGQYSHLVAQFMPRHLLPEKERALKEAAFGEPVGELDS